MKVVNKFFLHFVPFVATSQLKTGTLDSSVPRRGSTHLSNAFPPSRSFCNRLQPPQSDFRHCESPHSTLQPSPARPSCKTELRVWLSCLATGAQWPRRLSDAQPRSSEILQIQTRSTRRSCLRAGSPCRREQAYRRGRSTSRDDSKPRNARAKAAFCRCWSRTADRSKPDPRLSIRRDQKYPRYEFRARVFSESIAARAASSRDMNAATSRSGKKRNDRSCCLLRPSRVSDLSAQPPFRGWLIFRSLRGSHRA